MSRRTLTTRLLAAITIAVLPAAGFPALAQTGTAELSGVIRTAEGAPLVGVRLLAADTARGEVHRSEPTGPSGEFALTGLEPGTYDLAVNQEGGLYLVEEPIALVAGVKRSVRIAVEERPTAVSPEGAAPNARPSMWNNPLAASLLVIGIAIVVGVLVENATEDEPAASNVTGK